MKSIYVPTLKEVIENLRKFNCISLFSTVPIGEPATIYLRCDDDGYMMYATGSQDDIDELVNDEEGYEAWDELYIGDTEAELRACAHRLLTTMRDAMVEHPSELSDVRMDVDGMLEILEICA